MFLGSLTLHHWQQLATPHLATILDPHPGVVTKGFRPLAQDAVYHLSDMEEDEEGEEPKEIADLEKGAAEKCKKECDEEEEGGITFNVRCSSTPEDRRDRQPSVAPLSPTLSTSSGMPATSSSVQSDLCLTPCLATEKSTLSPCTIPGPSAAPVQTQSQIPTSTASSGGTVSL